MDLWTCGAQRVVHPHTRHWVRSGAYEVVKAEVMADAGPTGMRPGGCQGRKAVDHFACPRKVASRDLSPLLIMAGMTGQRWS